ncbi:hypothetical protein Y1Q_0001066 [Alligator mississippiensis]|uniref:Uncharacterized protein n=1 Tax=Alligator mississippiensis TaxID=8496 RepID=A0A151NEE5_ALLMI|nr:hypothetical protein Y1Q_0001066 [Alligator mississippiensis]
MEMDGKIISGKLVIYRMAQQEGRLVLWEMYSDHTANPREEGEGIKHLNYDSHEVAYPNRMLVTMIFHRSLLFEWKGFDSWSFRPKSHALKLISWDHSKLR